MLGWFRALMPKQERFFELFVRHAQLTLAAAEALRALLNGTGDPSKSFNDVHARENDADEITRDVLTALRRSFITPLDRGDIKDLITSMDDAIDEMNRTIKLIRLYEVRSFTPIMQEMGELIVRASKVSLETVPLLRSIGQEAGRLNSLTEEIIRIEGQSDELHERGRRDLFLSEKNAIAFMIGTEVYDHLEQVVDRFEDVANEISGIVIENV
jgi:predicted phosphate transport protein (TIGR00153 family)